MLYKRPELEGELALADKRLKSILTDLNEFCHDHDWGPILVTHVMRTQKKHTKMYEKVDKQQWISRSPHCDGRAADIRSREYSPKQINMIVDYLNDKYRKGWKYPVALYHTVKYSGGSHGQHIHIQVKRNPNGQMA